MNKETKKMVMGFVEYLQSIYGENGSTPVVAPVPPNSLAIPMFVTMKDDDAFSSLGQVADVMGYQSPTEILSAFDRISGGVGAAMGGGGMGMPGGGMPQDMSAILPGMNAPTGMPPELSSGITGGMPMESGGDPLQQMMMMGM